MVSVASARMPEARVPDLDKQETGLVPACIQGKVAPSHPYCVQTGQCSAAGVDHMVEVLEMQRATVHLAWLLDHRGSLHYIDQLVEELLPKIG